MTIPLTQFDAFMAEWWAHLCWQKQLRLGQAFYNWANLHKMTQTPWLDKLYNADSAIAAQMMLDALDKDN